MHPNVILTKGFAAQSQSPFFRLGEKIINFLWYTEINKHVGLVGLHCKCVRVSNLCVTTAYALAPGL